MTTTQGPLAVDPFKFTASVQITVPPAAAATTPDMASLTVTTGDKARELADAMLAQLVEPGETVDVVVTTPTGACFRYTLTNDVPA